MLFIYITMDFPYKMLYIVAVLFVYILNNRRQTQFHKGSCTYLFRISFVFPKKTFVSRYPQCRHLHFKHLFAHRVRHKIFNYINADLRKRITKKKLRIGTHMHIILFCKMHVWMVQTVF